jgi:hypothetical protein
MPLLTSGVRAVLEGMSDSGTDEKREVYMQTLSVVLAFVVALIIIALIGQLLWNNIIVDLFTITRPAKSFLHVLGLMVFINLILS